MQRRLAAAISVAVQKRVIIAISRKASERPTSPIQSETPAGSVMQLEMSSPTRSQWTCSAQPPSKFTRSASAPISRSSLNVGGRNAIAVIERSRRAIGFSSLIVISLGIFDCLSESSAARPFMEPWPRTGAHGNAPWRSRSGAQQADQLRTRRHRVRLRHVRPLALRPPRSSRKSDRRYFDRTVEPSPAPARKPHESAVAGTRKNERTAFVFRRWRWFR